MADTYTQALKARKIEQGAYADSYAERFNEDMVDIFDAGISGVLDIDIGSSTTYALEAMQNGTLSETHYRHLRFVGTPASAVTITVPTSVNTDKEYIVENQTGQSLTFKYAATAGQTIADGILRHLLADGTDIQPFRPENRRTAAEIAAGVVPVDYSYPPGNVLRYGTNTTPGTTDMTAAFNAAISSKYHVYAPGGQYLVSNIAVVDGMRVFGDKHHGDTPTTLLVGTNNAGAFRHSSSSSLFDIGLVDLHIKAASGVTGARAWLQSDKSVYTAYAQFENISTDKSLQISYDGFFIVSEWRDCIDGYLGSAPGAQAHQFIASLPSTFVQINQTNVCKLIDCKVYGATSGALAAVDIAYGGIWNFIGTVFEDMDTQAVRARGIAGGLFEGCWFENIRAANLFTLSDSSAGGCYTWKIVGCELTFTGFTGTEAFLLSGAVSLDIDTLTAVGVPASVTLVNGVPQVTGARNIQAISGAGASGFINVPMDQSGTATLTLTGVTASVTVTGRYEQRGRLVHWYVPTLSGTSNSVNCTITGIPTLQRPARQQGNHLASVTDNGTLAVGVLQVETTGAISCYPSITAAAGGWTAAGTKAIGAFNITYSLS